MAKAINAIRGIAHIFSADWVRSSSTASAAHGEPVTILDVLGR